MDCFVLRSVRSVANMKSLTWIPKVILSFFKIKKRSYTAISVLEIRSVGNIHKISNDLFQLSI